MIVEIHPEKSRGNWDVGYCLDYHTISSELLGTDGSGHPVFDTQRTPLGELVYKLKYAQDRSAISSIVQTVASFAPFTTIDVIVPVPPSNTTRQLQPVQEIARALGSHFGIPVLLDLIKKVKATPQLKDVTDQGERIALLRDAFSISSSASTEGKTALIVDDLYRSGATLHTITAVVRELGKARSVKVLALTRTRSKT